MLLHHLDMETRLILVWQSRYASSPELIFWGSSCAESLRKNLLSSDRLSVLSSVGPLVFWIFTHLFFGLHHIGKLGIASRAAFVIISSHAFVVGGRYLTRVLFPCFESLLLLPVRKLVICRNFTRFGEVGCGVFNLSIFLCFRDTRHDYAPLHGSLEKRRQRLMVPPLNRRRRLQPNA